MELGAGGSAFRDACLLPDWGTEYVSWCWTHAPARRLTGFGMELLGLRILLAEDNPTNRLVTVQMLESLGAQVAVACDGREALDRLDRERFDILLVDIEMPVLSGFDVIRRLATGRSDDGMTTIALTAYATPELSIDLERAGADGVIIKPIISIDQFGAEVRSIVQRRSVAAAAAAGNAGTRGPEIDRATYDALASAVGQDAFSDLLSKVDGDMTDAYGRMTRAISESDMSELRAATHILMSVAGAIGAVGLQGMAQRLNRAAHEDDEATIRDVGASAIGEGKRVISFVRSEYGG